MFFYVNGIMVEMAEVIVMLDCVGVVSVVGFDMYGEAVDIEARCEDSRVKGVQLLEVFDEDGDEVNPSEWLAEYAIIE